MPAKKQTQTLFVRAPFAPVAGSTADHYVVTTDAPAALVMEVEGTGPASGPTRLALQPVFPGRLTFKPKPGSVIPDDPSAAGAPSIQGDLYLQLSPVGLRELARAAPDLALPLLFGYLGITITRDFFTGTVLEALKDAKKPKTAEEKRQACKEFAEGKLSTDINPEKAKPVYAFPSVQPDPGSPWGAVTLALGVRTSLAASAKPPTLAELDAGAVMAPPDFAAIPIPFLYRQLRALPDWSRLAADGHAQHAFFDALARLEQAAAPGRWRRLRIFPLGDRPAAAYPLEASEAIQAKASAGSRTLWEEPLPRLGELYQKRPDGEAFRLELRTGTAAVPIGREPGDERRPWLDLTWAAPVAGAPPGIDVTAEVPRFADPLAGLRQDPPKPPPDVKEGYYDLAGRCFDDHDREYYELELIRPLQLLLRSFGYGTTAAPDGIYDARTAHAVREFQREAHTPGRMQGGQHVNTVITYAGRITGRVDTATWREILVWRTNLYRSINSYAAEKAPREVVDVAFATEDIDDHVIFTSAGTRLGRVQNRSGIVRGLANFKGTPLTTLVIRYPGKRWEKRAICEVAANESLALFEVLNTYDSSYLSVGLFQWTLGRISTNEKTGKPIDEPGELPAVCERLKPSAFAQLFGRWGLSVGGLEDLPFPPATPNSNKRESSPGWRTGRFFLDGERVEWEKGKAPFRSFRWTERFYDACSTDEFRLAQYASALARLQRVVRVPLHEWSPGGPVVRAGQLLQSELLCALALDQHVNRPGEFEAQNPSKRPLTICLDALLNIDMIITDDFTDVPLTDTGPRTWLTHAMEREARRLHGEPDAKKLTKPERDRIVEQQEATLRSLKERCHQQRTGNLGIHPATGLLASPRNSCMTQEQHDVLLDMYKWRRLNAGTLTLKDGRDNRATDIERGGRTGNLGNLERVPGQLTP